MTKGQYPTITRGMGNLTPDLWRRIMVMLEEYEKKNRNETGKQFKQNTNATVFLAQITDADTIDETDFRWHYHWEELEVSDDETVAVKAGGRSGEKAMNLCEIPNTEDNVAPAIDLNGETYPAGFEPRAIGDCIDETFLKVAVVMHRIVDTEGVPQYVFSLANSNDGVSCT